MLWSAAKPATGRATAFTNSISEGKTIVFVVSAKQYCAKAPYAIVKTRSPTLGPLPLNAAAVTTPTAS